MKPTPEQLAIYAFPDERPDNLIIEALAGSGKTSTLVGLCERLSGNVLAVAFNKRIRDELVERMPGHVECKTMNSVGYAALRAMVRKTGRPDMSKRRTILREAIAAVLDSEERERLSDAFMDLSECLGIAMNNGWLPAEVGIPNGRGLIDDDEFYGSLPIELIPSEADLIREVHVKGLREVFKNGWADFDDQIFIPTLYPASFPRRSAVLVDEAQDLSPIQHKMLEKIARGARVIAVGDSAQAIYGFRGADEDSMNKLRGRFAMHPLALSISFRLPRSVAEHVRWRVPHIQSPEWAKPGEVRVWDSWSAASIPDGAAIICRNNAPLFGAALRLLRDGRRPELVGNDIAKGLVKDLRGIAKPATAREEALVRLDAWTERQLRRYKNSKRVRDKAECLRLFIEDAENMGEAIAKAEQISMLKGSITLITGHKAKGLEWPHVFFLDSFLLKPEKSPQDANVRYVIATRAQETLTYIRSEDYAGH